MRNCSPTCLKASIPAARTANSTPAWWRGRCSRNLSPSKPASAWSATAMPIAISCSRRTQHAIERRQPDDDGRRDQGIADRAENGYAGASEQRGAEPDADRIDRTNHEREFDRVGLDQ